MTDPLSIRIGPLRASLRRSHPLVAELTARGDNISEIVRRDLGRYYALLKTERHRSTPAGLLARLDAAERAAIASRDPTP